jgi:hypothetical protein
MDLSAIQAAISSLKLATTVAKSILETKTMVEVQDKVIEIQSALLEAQNSAISATTAQFELSEKVRTLESELNAATTWSGETEKYALVSPFRNGGPVFALKASAANGEAPHLLCPNCFSSRRKSFLAPVRESKDGWIALSCSACKFSIGTGFRGIGDPSYAEDYSK